MPLVRLLVSDLTHCEMVKEMKIEEMFEECFNKLLNFNGFFEI
jgi:hypothetical protein